MPPVGFEPTISAVERPQTYALGRAAAGTGRCGVTGDNLWNIETYCVCNVSIIKLHIDIVHLLGYNEIDCVCACIGTHRCVFARVCVCVCVCFVTLIFVIFLTVFL